MIFNKSHKHKWEYERWNSIIVRSCIECGITQDATFIEEPQLIASAPTRFNPDELEWRTI